MSVTPYETYQPCCLSLFNWQHRTITDKNGNKHYRVRDTDGNVYTHPGPFLSKNDLKTRGIFLGLGLGSVPLVLLARIPLRLFSLFCGEFAKDAYDEALKEWSAECFKQAAIEKNQAGNGKIPSTYSFYLTVFLYSLRNLAIQLAFIAIYPLASMGLMFAGLWGALVDPVDGGKMWSTIERSLFHGSFTYTESVSELHLMLRSIVMLCRQPNHIRTQLCPPLSEELIRGSLDEIERQLLAHKQILAAVEIDVDRCLAGVDMYRKEVIPVVSPYQLDEARFIETGKKKTTEIHRSFLQHRHHLALTSYLTALREVVSALGACKVSDPHSERVKEIREQGMGALLKGDKWEAAEGAVTYFKGMSFDALVDKLKQPVQHESMAFYIESIEKLLVDHLDSSDGKEIKIDHILGIIRKFARLERVKDCDFAFQLQDPQYVKNKEFLSEFLRHLGFALTGSPKVRTLAAQKVNSLIYTDDGLAVEGGFPPPISVT